MIHACLGFIELLSSETFFIILGAASPRELVFIETWLPWSKKPCSSSRTWLLILTSSHDIWPITPRSEWNHGYLLCSTLISISIDSNRLLFKFDLRWLPIMRTSCLFQIDHFIRTLEDWRGWRNHWFWYVGILFFACLYKTTSPSLRELVGSNMLLLSAHIVWSQSIVHGSQVNIWFALLHVRLVQGLLRIKLNLMLNWALALWFLGFLDHQLHATLGKLLVELPLR